MTKRKNDFREEDKIRVLLWCARHCCLCGKFVGLGIEVAHLDPNKSDIDNAIPLCFDCHAGIGHYNARHPRGRKYSISELRARRNQIYDEHTRYLIAPVDYKLFQAGIQLPAVQFDLKNLGDVYPIKARVEVRLAQGHRDLGFPETVGHYDGRHLWNLNPRRRVHGHFQVPREVLNTPEEPLRARVDITLIDIYEYEHKLLPGGYIHRLGPQDEWYFEPSEEELRPQPRMASANV